MNTLDYIHLTNETLRAIFLSERLLYFSMEALQIVFAVLIWRDCIRLNHGLP